MRYYRPKVNKFVTLTVSVLVALNGGASYLFGMWSPLLKRHGLNQNDLAKLGAAHTGFGAYSSFIAGFVYDSLERRHHVGPRLTLLIGCAVSSIGYYTLYLAVTATEPVAFPLLVVLAMLAGNGCTWFDVSPMSTNLRNFPTERGSIVGIIKSCIGLCGGLYSIVFFQGLLHGDPAAFLKFLAYGPSLVVLLCTPFINYVPFVQESERWDHMNARRLRIGILLIGVLTCYVLGVSLVDGLAAMTPHMRGVFAVGAVILLLPLFGITHDSGGLFAERLVEDDVRGLAAEHGPLDDAPFLGNDRHVNDSEEEEQQEDNEPGMIETQEQRRLLGVYPSYTVCQCLQMLDFYLVAGITGIGIASGLSFLNNSPQLVAALGGSNGEKTVVLAFFSCASCLGRLIFGAASEHVLQVHRVSRVCFLIAAALGATLVYFVLSLESIASPSMLYPLSLLSGFTFGAHWAMLPSLASELFGLASFASIYSILQLFPGIGAYVMGSYVGERYDRIGAVHGDPVNECMGADCFASSFQAIAALSCFGVIGTVVLWRRTRGVYMRMVGRLLEVEAEVGFIQEASD